MASGHRRTVNIHTGRKLLGKTRAEILDEIIKCFRGRQIMAVQQFPETVRVTFNTEETALDVLSISNGVRLFDIWCRMDGGPPSTMIHLFDYPYEEGYEGIEDFFKAFGKVKAVRQQRYLTRDDIFTGTRLIDLVMEKPPPRLVIIQGYVCRVWYKGQPLICNTCGVQGHRASECPDKGKCRKCKQAGHLGRNCPNPPWGATAPSGSAAPPASPTNNDENDRERNVPPADMPPDPNVVPDDRNGAMPTADATVERDKNDPPASSAESSSGEPSGSNSASDASNLEPSQVPPEGVGVPSSSELNADVEAQQSQSLFSHEIEDDEVFKDASDGSDVDIAEFPSPPPTSDSPSQPISQFSDDSQSILQGIAVPPQLVEKSVYKSVDDSIISDSQNVDAASNAEGGTNPQSSNESTVGDTGGPDEPGGPSMDTSECRQRKSADDDHVAGNVALRSSHPVSRRKKTSDGSSNPVSSKGVHSGLPSVIPDRPART